MAVDALELRPRGAVALFDAAIRLVSRSSGLWAITLPGGALVTAAVLFLVESARGGEALLLPAALLTAAWFARGICQGAACHYLDRQLLDEGQPSVGSAFARAFSRMPSLINAVGYLFFFNLLSTVLTLGLGWLFLGAHAVAYPLVMEGEHAPGHPLALYHSCTQRLGGRGPAVAVRLLYAVQLLVLVNLQLGMNMLLYVGIKLLALDLTYVDRFIQPDNVSWAVALLLLTFTLFEPLRAATSTLLAIDGRVRQEGLDLRAALEQLPRRRSARPAGALASGAATLLLLLAPAAFAQESLEGQTPIEELPPSEASQRLSKVWSHCASQTVEEGADAPAEDLAPRLQQQGQLPQRERLALSRLVHELEYQAFEMGDCELVLSRLQHGLGLIEAAGATAEEASDAAAVARGKAKEILSRPEFRRAPEKVKHEDEAQQDEESVPEQSWFARQLDRFFKWLREWLENLNQKRDRDASTPDGSSQGFAPVVVGVMGLAALAVLGLLLFLAFKGKKGTQVVQPGVRTLEEGQPAPGGVSALSRPPDAWASLADQLAAQGEFREAIRHLYLALLSRLHRQGAIDYQPTRSNWDYFRAFRGPREQKAIFRELTDRFDFAYYGKLPTGAEGYGAFRELSRPLLAPSPEEEAAA
jgi:hypothetical protein